MTGMRKWAGWSLLLAAGGIAIWLALPRPAAPVQPAAPDAKKSARPLRPSDEQQRDLAIGTTQSRARYDWKSLLEWLRSNPPPTEDEIRARLSSLRKAWAEMDPQARAELIGQLLATGEDQPTGLPFEVGVHGLLAGWPTLRVFLLDVLATSDPEMAASIARSILDGTSSPDEFAVAIRSLTRDGLARAEDSEILHRFEGMLARPEWQNSPAFAEALDLARTVGTRDGASALLSWKGSPALKNTAMHEFAADHPAEMMAAISAEEDMAPLVRASLMSRADPAEDGQLAIVDQYLRSHYLAEEEAREFLKTFPLRSTTTGHRLYGETPAPYTFEQIKQGDQAALAIVESWLQDPALQRYQPELVELQQRLESWVEQANREDAED